VERQLEDCGASAKRLAMTVLGLASYGRTGCAPEFHRAADEAAEMINLKALLSFLLQMLATILLVFVG
jgi:hypothetical protein